MNTILYLTHRCSPERPFAIWIERPMGKESLRETRRALLAASETKVWCPYCGRLESLRSFRLMPDPLTTLGAEDR